MKKLNNKGYMLIEIILAFVLAIGITYFMTELVIKLKNKNDDLLVKTIVSTDQTIIYNTIMKDVYKGTFSCDKITIEGNKFIYDGKTINVVSEYASVGDMICNDETDETRIHIPISVKQIPDENFDVNIGLGDGIVGNSTLSCKLELTSDNVVKLSDDFSFGGEIVYQGFDSDYKGDNGVTSKTINSAGLYTYYIKTKNRLKGQCSIEVIGTTCTPPYNKNNAQTKCCKTDSSLVVTTITSCTCYTYSGNFSASLSYSTCYDTCYAGWGTELKSASSNTTSSCQNGGSYSGGTCYFCKPLECPDGYTNKANNSYCWKTIE